MTKEEEQLLVSQKLENPYITSKEQAQIFEISHTYVETIWRKNNCTFQDLLGVYSRKIMVNDHYFNEINSHNKAYLLGLLYADGFLCRWRHNYVAKTGRNAGKITESKYVGITLKDGELVEAIKKELGVTSKLVNWKETKRLCFVSPIMFDDLVKLGCVEKKTFLLKFPTEEQVPKEFIYSFVLGYLDGDGSIVTYKLSKHPTYSAKTVVSFTGTYEMLDGLRKLFHKDNLKMVKRWRERNNNNFTINFCGTQSPAHILSLLYENAPPFCLQRKKERYEKIMRDPRNSNVK